jgi:hypothetical protein
MLFGSKFTGICVTVALELLLGTLLIGRTVSTVLGYDEEKFFITTSFFVIKGRICEAISFVIWLLVTGVAVTSSSQINWNVDAKRPPPEYYWYYHQYEISPRVLFDVTIVTLAILYEFWMCAYIYETYASGDDLMVQLVIFLPTSSLIVNSLHQYVMFADQPPFDVFHVQQSSFLFMTITGLAFNIVMIIHLLCMAYSNLFNAGVFGAKYEKPAVMILGLAELYFRVWMVWRYFKLIYYIWKHPLRIPVAEENANPLGRLAIGRQYRANGDVNYAIQPHQATMDIIIIYVMPPLMLLPFLIIPGFL